MADTKITALTAITSITPATFPLPIVDLLDTTMAGSGTTKKVTVNQILGCGGTATLASATITGDLTVDTNTLKVDSANDVVGIGTATPASYSGSKLTVYTAANTLLTIGQANSYANLQSNGYDFYINTNVGGAASNGGSFVIRHGSSSAVQYNIASGVHTWQNVGGVAGTAMTLNATGLVVGTSPSAWGSGLKALQVANTGSYWFGGGTAWSASSYNYFGNNGYNNGSNWLYTRAYGAAQYEQYDNEHRWKVSTNSPSAGGNITFSQAMTLDASGNLLVGTTNSVVWNTTNQGCVIGPNAIQASRSGDTVLLLNRIGSNGKIALFAREGLEVGDISVTTTGTTFNSTSDYRLKEDVQPLVGGLARVSALKPSIYKWKSNGSSGEGFLAHELAEVVPAAVSGEKDAVNEDGTIKAQSIDMSRVVPILVAAIQELAAEVNALKNA